MLVLLLLWLWLLWLLMMLLLLLHPHIPLSHNPTLLPQPCSDALFDVLNDLCAAPSPHLHPNIEHLWTHPHLGKALPHVYCPPVQVILTLSFFVSHSNFLQYVLCCHALLLYHRYSLSSSLSSSSSFCHHRFLLLPCGSV